MKIKAASMRWLNDGLLRRYRLVLRKDGTEADNCILNPALRARTARGIAAIAEPYFATLPDFPAGDRTPLAEMVLDFMDLHERRPVRDNTGGLGFNGSLWLYLFVRRFRPRQVIECGTWQGHSSWLMAEAAPEAEIVSFDIEHDNLRHRHPRVAYRLGDWSGHRLDFAEPARALAFFDDHVSHARRLREAHERGLIHTLFDDNVTGHGVFRTGDPPLPSLALLHDPDIGPGSELHWRYRGREHRFRCTAADWESRALLAAYCPVPPLGPASPYREHPGLAYAQLRQAAKS